MAAEIKIYCIRSMRAAVGQELESILKNRDSTILGVELSTENRCKYIKHHYKFIAYRFTSRVVTTLGLDPNRCQLFTQCFHSKFVKS